MCRIYEGDPDAERISGRGVYFDVSQLDTTWNATTKDYDVELKAGQKAKLEVEIEGTPDSELSYQWGRVTWNSELSSEELITIDGATGISYDASESGEYFCRITDEDGESHEVFFYVYNETVEEGGISYYLIDSEVHASGYDDNAVEANIKSGVKFSDGKTYPVTVIGGFWGQKKLIKVTIPDSVTTISTEAFVNTGLKSITIPASVTFIGERAIGYKCESVETGEVDEDGDPIYEDKYTLVSDFVINGTAGSEAEKYAKANNIQFVDKAAADKAAAEAAAAADLAKTKPGTVATVGGATVKVIANVSGSTPGTVAYTKAPDKKSVTVPATVVINKKTFKVTQVNAGAFKGKKIRNITIGANVTKIAAKAFKGSKATKLTIKTKLLKKAGVKNCLKGSKIKTVKVSAGKKFVKSYKKIFTKKIAGKKVTVK